MITKICYHITSTPMGLAKENTPKETWGPFIGSDHYGDAEAAPEENGYSRLFLLHPGFYTTYTLEK